MRGARSGKIGGVVFYVEDFSVSSNEGAGGISPLDSRVCVTGHLVCDLWDLAGFGGIYRDFGVVKGDAVGGGGFFGWGS